MTLCKNCHEVTIDHDGVCLWCINKCLEEGWCKRYYIYTKQIDKEICVCGHHTRDHSYNTDFSTNLRCDICDCQEFKFDTKTVPSKEEKGK